MYTKDIRYEGAMKEWLAVFQNSNDQDVSLIVSMYYSTSEVNPWRLDFG